MSKLKRETTLFNKINGDVEKNKAQKMLWIINNIIHNILPQPELAIKNFTTSKIPYPSDDFSKTSSPSRILFNLFLLNLPIEEIQKKLSYNVNILDCGCGTGLYSSFVDKVFQSKITYRGFDIAENPNWSKYVEGERINFFSKAAETFSKDDFNDYNFIMSQSALEHFPKDLLFFETLASHLKETKKKCIQVHLLPAGNLWRLYKCHGYRGYNNLALKRIINLFEDFSLCEVFSLGGPASNNVHLKYLQDALNPLVKDKRNSEHYPDALYKALLEDFNAPEKCKKDPNTVALVIQSNITDCSPLGLPSV